MKKETKNDRLEKQRRIFLQIGFILALALVLAAFEWRTYEISLDGPGLREAWVEDEDLTKITRHEKPTPPPPKVKPVAVIKEVDNTVEVPDVVLFNPETSPTDSIPEFVYDPPEEPDGVNEDIPFTWVQEMPSFPGGEAALLAYLGSVKYTQMAREAGIEGTVIIGFVVEKDGSVSNIELLRGIGGGLDEAALENIRNMPLWNPGRQRTIPKRVKMVAPFKFKLQ